MKKMIIKWLARKYGVMIMDGITIQTTNVILTVEDGVVKKVHYFQDKMPGFRVFNEVLSHKKMIELNKGIGIKD